MKHAYKLLKIIYLFGVAIAVHYSPIKAADSKVQVDREAAGQEEQQEKKATKEPDQKILSAEEGEVISGDTGNEQTDIAATQQDKDSTAINLKDRVQQYIQQARERGISVTRSTLVQFREALTILGAKIEALLKPLLAVIAERYGTSTEQTAAELPEELRRPLGQITTKVAQLSTFITLTLTNIEDGKLLKQSDINARVDNLYELINRLVVDSGNFIRTSDPNNPQAQEVNNRVKDTVIQLVSAFRDALPTLADPFAPERQTSAEIAKIDSGIEQFRNLAPVETITTA